MGLSFLPSSPGAIPRLKTAVSPTIDPSCTTLIPLSGSRIHRLHLCREARPPQTSLPDMTLNLLTGEAPAREIYGMWSMP